MKKIIINAILLLSFPINVQCIETNNKLAQKCKISAKIETKKMHNAYPELPTGTFMYDKMYDDCMNGMGIIAMKAYIDGITKNTALASLGQAIGTNNKLKKSKTEVKKSMLQKCKILASDVQNTYKKTIDLYEIDWVYKRVFTKCVTHSYSLLDNY